MQLDKPAAQPKAKICESGHDFELNFEDAVKQAKLERMMTPGARKAINEILGRVHAPEAKDAAQRGRAEARGDGTNSMFGPETVLVPTPRLALELPCVALPARLEVLARGDLESRDLPLRCRSGGWGAVAGWRGAAACGVSSLYSRSVVRNWRSSFRDMFAALPRAPLRITAAAVSVSETGVAGGAPLGALGAD